MGMRYNFQCPECSCEASVSGGDDCGMISATTTITCAKCEKLYDVWVSDVPPLPESTDLTKLRCPRAKGHIIDLWTAPGPCPVCGTTLENLGPGIIWD